MPHFAYDEYHHLSAFYMPFPDGKDKPAFLLTSLSRLIERDIKGRHLEQHGLRPGIDYMLVTTPEIPSKVLGRHLQNHGGRRIILSLSGLLLLVLSMRTEASDRLRYFVVDEVLPGIMADDLNHSPEVVELRNMVAKLSNDVLMLNDLVELEGFVGDLTLADIVGTAADVVEEGDNT